MEAYYTREKGRRPIPLPSGSYTFAGPITAQLNSPPRTPPLPVREIPAPTSRAVGSGGLSDQRQEEEDSSCKMAVQSTPDKRRQLPDLQLRLDQLFEKLVGLVREQSAPTCLTTAKQPSAQKAASTREKEPKSPHYKLDLKMAADEATFSTPAQEDKHPHEIPPGI
ncbi:Hypothetical predicted protein [Pelobates cultripes]|uniref:Uncharacterized protein n=1 Tax=Pelobates cultripes TaxID=61616 RepID=A0AAD1SZP9_PELCU|nr:Hypothetical predicted protein [Pelobates cultripes]